jgi:hypothetical protein
MHGKLISLVVVLPLLAGLVQAQVVIPPSIIALESYDMPGYFLVCTTDAGPVQLVQAGNITPQGKWKVLSPGNSGTEGTVTFAPVALPNHFMRQTSFVYNCNAASTTWLDLLNETLIPEPGLADATAVSFRGAMYPNMYLQHDDSSPMGLILATLPANPGAATFKFSQDPERAKDPVPANKATDVPRTTALSWVSGVYAASHDVYFGTSLDDVNNATRQNPMGVLVSQDQTGTTFTPPERLEFSTTYYWRVDEVNAPPSSATYKGEVWYFTTEPFAPKVTTITATASSVGPVTSPAANAVNGSGLTGDLHSADPKTMWLSASNGFPAWIRFDFDQAYKLYQMLVWNHNATYENLLGFGAKDATVEYSTDGTAWTKLGDFEFAQAPGANDLPPTSIISFGGVAAKSVRITINSAWMQPKQTGLSEVQFLYIPVAARDPVPATGSTAIDPTTLTLRWRAGREAVSHNVYIGMDSDAVKASTTPAGTAGTASFTPTGLQLSTAYYWRVDEVNTAEALSTWTGPVWNFTTADFITVDDFESYDDQEGSAVFNIWIDGYGTTNNGAAVGYISPARNTYNETTIVHGGKQSMPLMYGQNGAATSEAARTFNPAQDWTQAGVKTLTLWFYGAPDNGSAALYVKINNTKIAYNGDAADIQRPQWNQWNVDLSAVPVGTLQGVTTLVIGVSNGASKGTLLIDDIRLYGLLL